MSNSTTQWRGPVPVSTRFDDPYYSLEDGIAETEHVFIAGNELAERFGAPLTIAELGFGTGLNFLVTWQAWLRAGAAHPLHFTSFEAFPLSAQDTNKALSAFPQLAPLSAKLIEALAQRNGQSLLQIAPNLTLELIIGDARETLKAWAGKADAWFLDGFAPAKNPELWESALLKDVFHHTAANGTAATYSAAGQIRRDLEEAGFQVERIKGFARKKHMTQARKAT